MEEIEEQYISQLVSSNENLNKNLPFILKNIWETNKTDSFIKSCKIFAERREKEIENICHAHYEVSANMTFSPFPFFILLYSYHFINIPFLLTFYN